MKREYPDRPIVGVGAVIVQDGRALIVRRATEPLKGEWSIPGGVVELGETLREAAEREAFEETGLTVEAGDVLEVFDSIYVEPEGRTKYHYVLVEFACRVTSGELVAGSDASEVRWTEEAELDRLVMQDSARKVLRKALAMTKAQTETARRLPSKGI